MYLKEQKNECWDTKNCSSGIISTIKTLLIVNCMGELLSVLFKCILKEILSLLSLDETVEKCILKQILSLLSFDETVENLKFPFSI